MSQTNQQVNDSAEHNYLSGKNREQEEKAFAAGVEVLVGQFKDRMPYMMIFGDSGSIQGNICPTCARDMISEWIEENNLTCWSESIGSKVTLH